MAEEKTLTIRPAPWSDAHALILARAMRKDSGGLADLQRRVEAGAASLLEVLDGARLIGAAVLWVDERAAGPEGVIAATAGIRGAGARLLDLLPEFERRLIAAGCVSIRVHPCRRGLLPFLLGHGYRPRSWELGKVVLS